jgi:hypothetical protein
VLILYGIVYTLDSAATRYALDRCLAVVRRRQSGLDIVVSNMTPISSQCE